PFSEESSRPGTFFGNRRQSGGLIFPILSTTVYDPNGNSTTIEFSDVRVNRGLSAGQFRFMMPAGVEVVRPTGKEMGF
ncbi:MAG: LolA family protein, partial [Desulfuromonadales bacterium]